MTDYGWEFPVYDEDGQEEISDENSWRGDFPQTIEGADCFAPSAFLQPTDNQVILVLTEAEFTKMFSALYIGAEFAYPQEYLQIIVNFLKGLHCPPELEPESSDCIEYAPSAPFITYHPDNPYVADDAAFGWYRDAWYRWGDFDTIFPDWIDTWLSGFTGSLLGYENNDILCNIASLGYVSWLAFLNDGGVFPKIEIRFSGTGVVELELLSFPLGGKAVIELDNEPNVLDILTSGVFDPAAFVVELDRDVVSFPPDEYPIVNVEVPVTTTGEHVLYVVFIPVVDDETTFLRFGGGLRSIELCGFEEQVTMGIEQLVWTGCELKAITGGVETVIVTAEQIEACLDIPSGGGGGTAMKVKTFQVTMPNTNFSTIAPSWGSVAAVAFNHTPTYSKMLVVIDNHILVNSGNNDTDIRWLAGGNAGVDATIARVTGSNGREVQWSSWWEDLTPGVSLAFQMQGRVSAGTGTINGNTALNVTIIEFDNPEDLYVEDIRYLDGLLEKKIGGVWLGIVDIDALLAPIQALASSANAAAAAAQADADNAQTVNSAQQVVLNNHENRIDDLEDWQDDIDLSVSQINLTLNDHENRIDAIEASSGFTSPYLDGGVWSHEFDWTLGSQLGWSAIDMTYVNGFGWNLSTTGAVGSLTLPSVSIKDSRITHIKLELFRQNSGAGTLLVNFPSLSSNAQIFGMTGGGTLDSRWYKVTNQGSLYTPVFYFSPASGNGHQLKRALFIGRGENPFI